VEGGTPPDPSEILKPERSADKAQPQPLPQPVVPRVPPSPTPHREKKPIYKEWWFWAAVGGGLAVAGGTGAIIYAATAKGDVEAGSLGKVDLR
jgi:hypothetical protein